MGSVEFWALIVAIVALYLSLRSEMNKNNRQDKDDAIQHEARHVIAEKDIKALKSAVSTVKKSVQAIDDKIDAKFEEIIEILKGNYRGK